MRRQLGGAAVALLLLNLAGCGPRPRPGVALPDVPVAPAMIHVRTAVEGQKQIVALPLEEYVLASVLSELAPSTGDAAALRRAFEVQAIVARTYAVANRGRHRAERFDLCDTTHCQLVDLERPRRSRWANLARAAIDATRGAVIYDGMRPATVLFHADCGGHRASATDVWGGAAGSYLRGGPDPLPDGSRHLTWHYAIEREKLRAALNSTERTSVGGRLDTIEVQSRDASGRARLLLLNGERAPLVRGEDFRGAMNAALGASAIRSARFDVRRDGNTFVFDGEGFGHGVGLCQRGALAHASAGTSVANIIEFYFPGTTVRTTVQHVRNLMPSLRAVACRAPHGPAHQRTRAASAHQG